MIDIDEYQMNTQSQQCFCWQENDNSVIIWLFLAISRTDLWQTDRRGSPEPLLIMRIGTVPITSADWRSVSTPSWHKYRYRALITIVFWRAAKHVTWRMASYVQCIIFLFICVQLMPHLQVPAEHVNGLMTSPCVSGYNWS